MPNHILEASDALARTARRRPRPLTPALGTCRACGETRMITSPAPLACRGCAERMARLSA